MRTTKAIIGKCVWKKTQLPFVYTFIEGGSFAVAVQEVALCCVSKF